MGGSDLAGSASFNLTSVPSFRTLGCSSRSHCLPQVLHLSYPKSPAKTSAPLTNLISPGLFAFMMLASADFKRFKKMRARSNSDISKTRSVFNDIRVARIQQGRQHLQFRVLFARLDLFHLFYPYACHFG